MLIKKTGQGAPPLGLPAAPQLGRHTLPLSRRVPSICTQLICCRKLQERYGKRTQRHAGLPAATVERRTLSFNERYRSCDLKVWSSPKQTELRHPGKGLPHCSCTCPHPALKVARSGQLRYQPASTSSEAVDGSMAFEDATLS